MKLITWLRNTARWRWNDSLKKFWFITFIQRRLKIAGKNSPYVKNRLPRMLSLLLLCVRFELLIFSIFIELICMYVFFELRWEKIGARDERASKFKAIKSVFFVCKFYSFSFFLFKWLCAQNASKGFLLKKIFTRLAVRTFHLSIWFHHHWLSNITSDDLSSAAAFLSVSKINTVKRGSIMQILFFSHYVTKPRACIVS